MLKIEFFFFNFMAAGQIHDEDHMMGSKAPEQLLSGPWRGNVFSQIKKNMFHIKIRDASND